MMGAELLIEEIQEQLVRKYGPELNRALRERNAFPTNSERRAAAQRRVKKYCDLIISGSYFHDSYNLSSVLWCLGLSWWRDVARLVKRDKLKGNNLRTFRDMVAAAELQLPTRADLKKGRVPVIQKSGPNSLAGLHKYITEKRAELLVFLDKAIELDASVLCSL